MTWFLTWLLAPIVRAEIDRIVARYGPELLARAASSRKALDDAEQTAKRAEHKADHLAAQVQDHENHLRALEPALCSCGDPEWGERPVCKEYAP
jgi:hypothetical protein